MRFIHGSLIAAAFSVTVCCASASTNEPSQLAGEAVEASWGAETAGALGALRQTPDLPSENPRDFGGRIARAYRSLYPQMRTELASVYAATYTPEELRAMRDFYRSPEGRSIARKQQTVWYRMSSIGMDYNARAVAAARQQ